MPYLICYVRRIKWQLIADVESVQVIISVFREIVREEVTRSVVIGILHDLSVAGDLLHQRGYPKRGNLARGKQVIFNETTTGFPQNDVSGMSGKIPH